MPPEKAGRTAYGQEYEILFVLELRRLPLVDEGGHAFLLVVDGEQRVEQAALEAHALGEGRLVGAR